LLEGQVIAHLDGGDPQLYQVDVWGSDLAHIDDHLAQARINRFGDLVAHLRGDLVGNVGSEVGGQDDRQNTIALLEVLVGSIEAEGSTNLGFQIIWIQRLGDHTHEAHLLGPGLVFGGCFDGETENRCALGSGAGPKHLEKSKSGSIGQRKADQNGVGNVLGTVIKGFAGLGAPMNLPWSIGDGRLDLIDDGWLVIDDQNVERVIIPFDLLDPAALGLQLDDATCTLNEHVLFEGLHEVVANSHFGDLGDVVPARFGGEHDHRDILQVGVGLQLRQTLGAVHDGHRQVQKYQVGLFAHGHRDTLDAVGGLKNVHIEGFQRLGDNQADCLAVIDSQNLRFH